MRDEKLDYLTVRGRQLDGPMPSSTQDIKHANYLTSSSPLHNPGQGRKEPCARIAPTKVVNPHDPGQMKGKTVFARILARATHP